MNTIKQTTEFPKNFCSVPWLQIHTEPDGKVMPCCYYSHQTEHKLGNWKEDQLKTIFHNDKWNDLRKQFLEGKRPGACFRCWKEEDSGIVSMRQRFNERYQNWPDHTNQNYYNKFNDIEKLSSADGQVGDIKLATIDLIFNNLCNFKCRSCGPGLSTSWAADAIKLGNPVPTLLTNDEISHMKDDLVNLVDMVDPYTEIHFSGGEPMMQEEHYEFLKLLIDMGKTTVKIRYNTNLSTYKLKNYNAFELLRNFENVFIIGSIDAMGAKGEYIRKGFDWEQALDWIKTCKENIPTIDFGISAVYSLLNCEAAIDLHRYICTNDLFKKYTGDTFGFNLNVLHFPDYIRTTVLPAETKKRVTEKIQKHIEWLEQTQPRNFDYPVFMEHWTSAMTLMNSNDETHLIPKFFNETQKLDTLRNESFKNVFPELWIDLINHGNK
jgi:radical SAM protein with 4Fe4S-binding SPASM domain